MVRPTIFALVAGTFVRSRAQAPGPPLPADTKVQGTNILDHTTPIKGFLGQTFLEQNIPYIDIPDSNIEEIFYFRWSSLQRHLRYTTPGAGYITTEFVQPVGYSMAFDTIDAAAGHHIEEARWYRSSFYANDYTQFWTRGPGDSMQYTHWILHAAVSLAEVTGDASFLTSQLPGMVRMWHEWDYTFDSGAGLYYFTPTHDAQEYSLPGYVADAAVNNTNDSLQRDGPNTYRPSHNAYMVANARAIASVATMTGNSSIAMEFTNLADALESAMYEHLWDPNQDFFQDVIRPNNSDLIPIQGREEVGFYPFRFGIGLMNKYIKPSVSQLFDPEGFFVEYAPSTLEVRNTYYRTEKPTSYCCFWNGQSWPFSTAHTIKSLAQMYRSGNGSVTADQYYQYLSIFATTQHKDGNPYIAEAHYPDTDSWSADTTNHSQFYAHSTYNDNVITGLLGIIPSLDDTLEIDPIIPSNWTYFALENLPYHGALITVLYDHDGSKYNMGKGLTVFSNGKKIFNGPGPGGKVTLSGGTTSMSDNAPMPLEVNIAANPYGLGAWPKASATYTWQLDDPYKAIDGYLFYDPSPDNRWTNYKSPNENDTLTIQLPRPRQLKGIVLAIYSDLSEGGQVDCPAALKVTSGTGALLYNNSNFTSNCLPNDKNIITFPGGAITTDTVNINFFSQPNLAIGVAEVEFWVPANVGPLYYAADAVAATNAHVAFDSANSKATANGAVMAPNSTTSAVWFSGIYSPSGGATTLGLSYRNSGSSSISVAVQINRMSAGKLMLAPTGASYSTLSLEGVELWKGTNFVTVTGGGAGLFLESIHVA